jgi:hypothetical protein
LYCQSAKSLLKIRRRSAAGQRPKRQPNADELCSFMLIQRAYLSRKIQQAAFVLFSKMRMQQYTVNSAIALV